MIAVGGIQKKPLEERISMFLQMELIILTVTLSFKMLKISLIIFILLRISIQN